MNVYVIEWINDALNKWIKFNAPPIKASIYFNDFFLEYNYV